MPSMLVAMQPIPQTSIQQKVELFFNREDVSHVLSDTSQVSKGVPNQFALGHYLQLFRKFGAKEDCSYCTFLREIPHYVRKPKARDWGTCLCIIFLNPELKIEALQNRKLLEPVDVEEAMNSDV